VSTANPQDTSAASAVDAETETKQSNSGEAESPTTAERMLIMDRLLLRVPEVASRLSMSRGKVYELIRSGVLPSVRIDRARRIRTCDLESFVGSLTSART
jgi:excisionase family DNA binding protein